MIPNKLHVVWFGGRELSLLNYLCLRSAVVVNKYHTVFMHCDTEPAGRYWQQLKSDFRIIHREPPRRIGGRDVVHVAHQADIARLEILIEHGGTYLDTDVLCVRPMNDLYAHQVVIGVEGFGGPAEVSGTGNAVILGQPTATFLVDWLAGFDPAHSRWDGFRSRGRDQYWSEYSIQYPAFLAKGRADVTVLEPEAFFYPMWYQLDLEEFFLGSGPVVGQPYCHHLWQSHPWVDQHVSSTSLTDILTDGSTFSMQLQSVFGSKGELL